MTRLMAVSYVSWGLEHVCELSTFSNTLNLSPVDAKKNRSNQLRFPLASLSNHNIFKFVVRKTLFTQLSHISICSIEQSDRVNLGNWPGP